MQDFEGQVKKLINSENKVTQSCLTLCEPINCSLPSSSVHGILQARVLEWVAISFSRGCSRPRDPDQVSCIAGRFFTIRAPREAQLSQKVIITALLCSEVAQLCPTLCDPMDCSLSGSSVHGIFQARVLEYIAIFFSRGSS